MKRLLLPVLILSLTGCAIPAFFFGPTADSEMSEDLSLVVYPKEAALGDDLDIIALKRGNKLTLINRTPREYHDLQIWLNQQYVGKVDHIPIGTETVIYLNACINEFGEPFPVGGLLNAEKSYPVVLVELFTSETPEGANQLSLAAGKRHRMTVRMDEDSSREASGRSTEGDIAR
ncbi:MAG: hypothetical protein WD768_22465 [Phycisphaeraceae bacterium]